MSTPQRRVVSFVRRTSRMNESQQKAWDRYAAELLVPFPAGELGTSVLDDATPMDWAAPFGREAPLIVEIGPGVGDSLVAMAAARPEHNVLAFEVFSAALASTMIKIRRAGLDNVRLIQADAVQALDRLFEPDSIAEVWTFFPDPWPKSRHHKRRLVTARFAELLADRVRSGGHWRLATDWPEYADWMRQTLDPHPRWGNDHPDGDGWAPRPAERPITRFEQRGLDAGRPVRDLSYRRLP